MAAVRKNRIKKLKNRVFILMARFCNKKINPEIKEILDQLYPGEDTVKRYREFQVRKYMIMLAIVFIGTAAAVCMHLSSRTHGRLAEGTCLIRNEWGEGNYSVVLEGATERNGGEITYEIKERALTEEERLFLKEQMEDELPESILGENENLMAVNKDLELVSEIPGYPFQIIWQSSDQERIRSDGKVNTANLPPEGEEILLTAVCTYEEESWKMEIIIRLVPRILTPQEQYLAAMQEEILENDMLYTESHEIRLPEKIGDESVLWKEKKEDNSFWLLILGFLGAVLVSLSMDRDLKQKGKRRSEEMIRSYSEFVSKLQLYMGAGLTVRNAFLRIGKEYQEEKNRTGKSRFLYEEVLISGYEFLNGKPENEVYREWGRRCGGMKYRKLSFLLSAHLRQGNDKILSVLSEETDLALEDRKSRARKQGEEAGTKLLLPMMMMLVVVMFLIILPAFSGFGAM